MPRYHVFLGAPAPINTFQWPPIESKPRLSWHVVPRSECQPSAEIDIPANNSDCTFARESTSRLSEIYKCVAFPEFDREAESLNSSEVWVEGNTSGAPQGTLFFASLLDGFNLILLAQISTGL